MYIYKRMRVTIVTFRSCEIDLAIRNTYILYVIICVCDTCLILIEFSERESIVDEPYPRKAYMHNESNFRDGYKYGTPIAHFHDRFHNMIIYYRYQPLYALRFK